MTKMLDETHPQYGWSPVVAGLRPRDATNGATLDMSDAPTLEMNTAGFLKASGRFRGQIDVEIGGGSECGARRWSRRLVQLYEDVGLVRLDR